MAALFGGEEEESNEEVSNRAATAAGPSAEGAPARSDEPADSDEENERIEAQLEEEDEAEAAEAEKARQEADDDEDDWEEAWTANGMGAEGDGAPREEQRAAIETAVRGGDPFDVRPPPALEPQPIQVDAEAAERCAEAFTHTMEEARNANLSKRTGAVKYSIGKFKGAALKLKPINHAYGRDDYEAEASAGKGCDDEISYAALLDGTYGGGANNAYRSANGVARCLGAHRSYDRAVGTRQWQAQKHTIELLHMVCTGHPQLGDDTMRRIVLAVGQVCEYPLIQKRLLQPDAHGNHKVTEGWRIAVGMVFRVACSLTPVDGRPWGKARFSDAVADLRKKRGEPFEQLDAAITTTAKAIDWRLAGSTTRPSRIL